jgi:hypothetical protein
MSQPYNIRFGSGITVGHGVTAGSSGGGPAPGDITITFNEFSPGGGGPLPFNLQDSTASISGTGITINNSAKSGVLMAGISGPNATFLSANLPDTTPGGDGEVWTAHWSSGSTYSTTPVAIYYSSSIFGNPGITFWILNPADGSYNTGTAGTFNWPMTLTAGTTITHFNPS